MHKERIEFTGRSQNDISNFGPDEARDMFLDRFFTAFYKIIYPDKSQFLDSKPEAWRTINGANIFWGLFKEMIKNIHDHNGGWGYCELEVSDDKLIQFEIRNSTNPNSEDNEHTPETKKNYGVGLNLAKHFLSHNFISTFDIDKDYLYKGSYQMRS